jgi:hypothetical protein
MKLINFFYLYIIKMYHYIIAFVLLFLIYKYFFNHETFTGTVLECSDKSLDEGIYDYSTSQLNKQKY